MKTKEKIAFFTLIGWQEDLSVSPLRFFKRCDKLEQQNTPLFLKEKGGAGERENFFSREKKFSLSPRKPFHFDRTPGRNCDYRNSGGNAAAGVGFGEKAGNRSKLYK